MSYVKTHRSSAHTTAELVTTALAQARRVRPQAAANARLVNWVAQRHPADDGLAVVKNLFRVLGARITDATVDEELPRTEAYPSLGAIWRFLARWGIDAKGTRMSADRLREASYPAVAHLTEGQFVLLVGHHRGRVYLLHPGKGWRSERLAAFGAAWDGTLLLPSTSASVAEPDYEARRTLEERHRATDPRQQKVALIEDVLTAEQCDDGIRSIHGLRRSRVAVDCGEQVVSEHRTSTTAALPVDHALTRRVQQICADTFAEPLSHCEVPSLIAYRPGREYEVHVDALGRGTTNPTPDADRLGTLIVYLNDNIVGGETYFPDLDLKVTPRIGMAAAWRNLTPQGEIDYDARHAGLPVFAGTKYALVSHVWTRPRAESKRELVGEAP